MDLSPSGLGSPSRLRLLLEHFSRIEDARASHRVAFPMAELLLLAVCGTIADCDDYDAIADWGKSHLDFLRRYLPYHHGVPGERWLTILMNRLNPALFSAAFGAWVQAAMARARRSTGHRRQDFTPQPRQGRRPGSSASCLCFRHHQPPRAGPRGRAGQEWGRYSHSPSPGSVGRRQRPQGDALVSIDAIATNATIASAIQPPGPTIFSPSRPTSPRSAPKSKAISMRRPPNASCIMTIFRQGAWPYRAALCHRLRRNRLARWPKAFPGRISIAGRQDHHPRQIAQGRTSTTAAASTHASSYPPQALTAAQAALAVRNHWIIENGLHWVLDVTFQARINPGCARDMAPKTWRSSATSPLIRSEPRKNPSPAPAPNRAHPLLKTECRPRKQALKLRRKIDRTGIEYLKMLS